MPVLSACVCVPVCVFVRGWALTAAHLAPQWTMEVQLRLGSAQMSLHSQVPRCVTLFPVTFSAINLQTYSDGAPLWGYIVPVCHTVFWMVWGVVRALACRWTLGCDPIATCKGVNVSLVPFHFSGHENSKLMGFIILFFLFFNHFQWGFCLFFILAHWSFC